MDDALVLANSEDGILWLTLNRPERRNPLSSDMIGALGSQRLIANLCEGLSGKEQPELVAAFVDEVTSYGSPP